MIITTTNEIKGKEIKEYRGIIFGEVINGIDYGRDFAAAFKNIYGGRVTEYEEELVNARADAIKEMMDRATQVGANAIIGVHIDYETIGQMLMVVATGTAVVIE
ncbi:MAG: YbjQ family protein [Clostridia bacterium]|nr:YbjQ family protein [Clostridia bacterium]